MANIGYTRKPDGQNRVPPSTLVPGRHLIGQRPPRPESGRISNGSTRFWLLAPPSATRFQSHLPDYGRAIRPAARKRTRHRVIAGRGGSFLRSTWSCVRQNFNFVAQSVCDAPIINTSYQKLPFGSGDYPDKLLFHQATKFVTHQAGNYPVTCFVSKSSIIILVELSYGAFFRGTLRSRTNTLPS